MDYWHALFEGVKVQPFTWQVGLALFFVLFLLLFSGYMSSSETAFFSLSPQDLATIKESDASSDKKLLHLLGQSEQLLATILIGNNIVNIGIVFLSNYIITSLVDFGIAIALSFILQTIGLTFILLLFGEITPKVIARQNPLKMSRLSAPLMSILFKGLAPGAKALTRTSRLSDKGSKKRRKQSISVDDLSKAVELTEGKSPEQSEIMEGIIKFHDKTAVEILSLIHI